MIQRGGGDIINISSMAGKSVFAGGGVYCASQFLRHTPAQSLHGPLRSAVNPATGGDIINISSMAGKSVFAGGGVYCASKWAVQGLSGCMAEELREHGIRVSTVCPGSVATEFGRRGPKDPTKVLKPEDVAHAVTMIALQGPQSF